MVEMMRGVTSGGGTAPGASAAGHQLAGKTGTVNDHTDVWFIGYTPTYVTGVWMGNPERKESLGRGMTGGGGALPYFNEFMNAFMKDKEKDKFEDAPPVPSDIKSLIERRKREELEKLEKAEQDARKTGAIFTPSKKTDDSETSTITDGETGTDAAPTNPTDTEKRDNNPPSKPVPKTDSRGKPDIPVEPPPVKKTDPPAQNPGSEGTKRKGKKGDG